MLANIVDFSSTYKFLQRDELTIPAELSLIESEIHDSAKSHDAQGNPDGHRNTEAHDANSEFFLTPEILVSTRPLYPADEHDKFFGNAQRVLHIFKAHAPIMLAFTQLNYWPQGIYRVGTTLVSDLYNISRKKRKYVGNLARFRALWSYDNISWHVIDPSPDGWVKLQTNERRTYQQTITLEKAAIIGWQFQIPVSHEVNGLVISDLRVYETMTQDQMIDTLVSNNSDIRALRSQLSDMHKRLMLLEA